MKTMKNFAAQQLTKTQMNEVKGGRIWCYAILDGIAIFGNSGADSVKDAERMLHQTYDGVYDKVIAVCDERS